MHYAHEGPGLTDLPAVIRALRPTALIGVSGGGRGEVCVCVAGGTEGGGVGSVCCAGGAGKETRETGEAARAGAAVGVEGGGGLLGAPGGTGWGWRWRGGK